MRVGSVTCLPLPQARQPTLAVITAVALSCILCGILFLSGIGGLSTLDGALFLNAGGLLTGIALVGAKKTSKKKKRRVPPLDLTPIKRAQDPSLCLGARVKALLPANIPPDVIPQITRGFDLSGDIRKKMVWCVELIEDPPQAKFVTVPTIPETISLPTETSYLLFILDTSGSLIAQEYTTENNLLSYLALGYENGTLLSRECLKKEASPNDVSALLGALFSKKSTLKEATPSFKVEENTVIYSNGCVQTFANAELASTMGTELILRGLERTEMLTPHEIEQSHLNMQKRLQGKQFWYGHNKNIYCLITKNKITFYKQEPTERLMALQLFEWEQVAENLSS